MDECELIALISTLACSISKCYSTDEIALFAVIFSQLGDTLATIVTKRELNDKLMNNNKGNDDKDHVCDSP